MICICYTCITGPIPDKLYPPQGRTDTVGYVAFSDKVTEPGYQNGWLVRPALCPTVPARYRARLHKLMPMEIFPDVEYSLWLDGCLTPRCSVVDLVTQYLGKHDICTFQHAERDCVYQEAEACIRLRKDDPRIIREQVDRYRQEGYPYHNGLAETTAVLRRHTPAVQELQIEWRKELSGGSVRDQLSFNYVAWKLGMCYATFAGTRTHSPHFIWRPHR